MFQYEKYIMRPTIRLANKIYNIGTPMLGRWSLTYNYSIQNRKVYLTNMDHYGCCEVTKKEQIDETSTANDEFLLPYCI